MRIERFLNAPERKPYVLKRPFDPHLSELTLEVTCSKIAGPSFRYGNQNSFGMLLMGRVQRREYTTRYQYRITRAGTYSDRRPSRKWKIESFVRNCGRDMFDLWIGGDICKHLTVFPNKYRQDSFHLGFSGLRVAAKLASKRHYKRKYPFQ